jgi:hypothetical protein
LKFSICTTYKDDDKWFEQEVSKKTRSWEKHAAEIGQNLLLNNNDISYIQVFDEDGNCLYHKKQSFDVDTWVVGESSGTMNYRQPFVVTSEMIQKWAERHG